MVGFVEFEGEAGVKILAFSDLHCDASAATVLVEAARSADLVLGVGDFAQLHNGLPETMELLSDFADKAIYVPGNNETFEALKGATDAFVIHQECVDIDGLKIAGLGCAVPPLPPTAWGSFDMTEDDAEAVLAQMESADILMSHSPPKGVVDFHADLGSLGSVAVRGWIKTCQPKLVLCGHIHDCWGQSAEIGSSQIFNLGPQPNWFEI